MSDDCERFWSSLPDKAFQPIRAQILEALRTIDAPLSAVELVDVLDGEITMWEAAHHLSALESFEVVKRVEGSRGDHKPAREDELDARYRLEDRDSDDNG